MTGNDSFHYSVRVRGKPNRFRVEIIADKRTASPLARSIPLTIPIRICLEGKDTILNHY